MAELIIDVSSCKTALQFLDTVGKTLGKPMGNFSMLEQYLTTNYYSQIIFVGMEEFSVRCPHATREMETILRRVRGHYQDEKKKFEFNLQV